MKKGWSVAARISAPVFTVALLLFLALGYYYFSGTQKILKNSAVQAAHGTSSALGLEISRTALEIEGIARFVSGYSGFSSRWILQKDSVESRRLYAALGDRLAANVDVLGIGVLIDPHSWEQEAEEGKHAPYAARSGDSYVITDLAEFDPAYLDSKTYTLAKEAETPVWGNPFFLSELTAGAVTLAYPFEHGVVICDIALGWLNKTVNRIAPPYGGGIIVRAPDSRILANTTEILNVPDLAAFAKSGDIVEMAVDGERQLFHAALSQETGWLQIVSTPLDALTKTAKEAALPLVFAGAAGAFLLAFAAYMACGPLSKSLKKLDESVLLVARGEADTEIPGAEGWLEASVLSGSLKTMRDSLKKDIDTFKDDLINEERKKCESEIARSISDQYLKKTFPQDPKYSIAAKLSDFAEIAGDFYDFIPTDRGTLYLVSGSVSTSGAIAPVVSNSLISYLRAMQRGGQGPTAALNALAESFDKGEWCTPSGTKVRLILMEFYPSTGSCAIANAGADRPIVIRDGKASLMDVAKGHPIGTGQRGFATGIFNLAKDDRIIFYTGTGRNFADAASTDEAANLTDSVGEIFLQHSESPESLLDALTGRPEDSENKMPDESETFAASAAMLLHYH